jgi:hypothetical protein
MKVSMKIIRGIGLVLLRLIHIWITLGLFWRFHWVTNQIRVRGGRHAGVAGMIYVHSDGQRLVVSRMLAKTHIALRQIAAVDRAWFPWIGVQIDTTGSRNPVVPTWTPRALAEYIEAAAMPLTPAVDDAARAA